MSLFAQELGTAEPVSAVKLDRALAELHGAPRANAEAMPKNVAPSAPAVMPLTSAKKTTPLKNLGALDRLFAR